MKAIFLLLVIFCYNFKCADSAYIKMESFTASSETVACGQKVTFKCSGIVRPDTVPLTIKDERSQEDIDVKLVSKSPLMDTIGGQEVEFYRKIVQGTRVMGLNDTGEYTCTIGSPDGGRVSTSLYVTVTHPCNTGYVVGISSALPLVLFFLHALFSQA